MRLTENMILARAKTSNLGTIKRINLWGCDLTDISILQDMPNVEVLALSINKLSCLQPLAACVKLQVLYLRKNDIHDFGELKHLQNLPNLKELWLGENPCATTAGSNYRATVVKMLPNLKKLDDEEITSADIEASRNLNSTNRAPPEPIKVEPEVQPEKVSPPPRKIQSPEVKKPEQRDEELIEYELEQQIENINSKQKVVEKIVQPEIQQPQQSQREQAYITPQKHTTSMQSIPPQKQTSSMQSIPPVVEDFDTQRSRLSLPASFNQMTPVTESQEAVTQIPQLKVVLQIQQPQQQSQAEQPPSVQYPEWHKPPNAAGAYGGQGNYDTYSESAAHVKKDYHSSKANQGSRSSRTRVSQGLNNDSGWDSFNSRTNRENKSQRAHHQFDGAQANNNRSPHHNENLNWGDNHNTHRSNASRTTSSSSTMNTSRSTRRNSNVYSALLCVVPELDLESLQVLEHSVQCRLDELSGQ